MKRHHREPLTVEEDRYGGIYSGGAYTAWPRRPEDVPTATSGDGEVCDLFWMWARENNIMVGLGDTREEAIRDLKMKLEDHPDFDPRNEPRYLGNWRPPRP